MKSNTKNGLFGSAITLLAMLFIVSVTFISCQDSSVTSLADNNPALTPMVFGKGGNGNGNSANVPDNLTPNSQRYNDSSMPAASGRDGEVVVTARALINSAGVTDLEVTTGSLDTDETAPGTLTKLLVKALDSETPDIDDPVWEQNYNRLRDGGYFTTSYDNLAHGQPLYVHSNVRGIIRGMAVVKLTETVKFRPDLSVADIDAPSDVYIGDPVNINAQITEGLGDLGATANCVMYVDGEETDRADGIWVDAGDAVVCAFATSFNNVGTKEVTVAVEDVIPGDYDMGNNSESVLIEVLEPSDNDFWWSASAYIDTEPFFYYYNSYWWYNHTYTQYGKRQNFYAYGWKDGNVDFPMDIDVQVSSGGNEWVNESITNANPNYNWYYSCHDSYLPNNAYIRVCDYDYNWYDRTHVYVNRHAADVVYISSYNGYYHEYERNDTMLPYGNDVAFDVQLTGASENARMSGEIQLSAGSADVNHGYYIYKAEYLSGYNYGFPE